MLCKSFHSIDMRKTGDMSKKRIKAEVKKCHIVEKSGKLRGI